MEHEKKTGGITGRKLDYFLKALRLLQLSAEEQQDPGSATSAIYTATAVAYANVIEGLEMIREVSADADADQVLPEASS